MAKLEHADERRAKPRRRITLHGKVLTTRDADPIAIARVVHMMSPTGKREARLLEAEKKVAAGR